MVAVVKGLSWKGSTWAHVLSNWEENGSINWESFYTASCRVHRRLAWPYNCNTASLTLPEIGDYIIREFYKLQSSVNNK